MRLASGLADHGSVGLAAAFPSPRGGKCLMNGIVAAMFAAYFG